LQQRLVDLLWRQLRAGELPGLELQVFRELISLGRDADSLDALRGVLDGEVTLAGLQLGVRDRFATAAALVAVGEATAEHRLAQLQAGQSGDDVTKYAYVARAAAPVAEVKASYFAGYLNADEPPEQWIEESLGSFHWPGQAALTLPSLERALGQVDWVKQHRKIFFMPAWIDQFVNGHSSPEALAIVERFLERQDLSIDIRRKVLQSVDELRRAVRIRAKF
jgi:aminopeptidase N